MEFKIAIAKDEEGMYVVECLNLPGCISQGETKEKALENIKDAIKGYLVSLEKHGEEIPFKKISQVMAINV